MLKVTVDMGKWYLPIVSPASPAGQRSRHHPVQGLTQCHQLRARRGGGNKTGLVHDVMQPSILQGSGEFR